MAFALVSLDADTAWSPNGLWEKSKKQLKVDVPYMLLSLPSLEKTRGSVTQCFFCHYHYYYKGNNIIL